MGKLLFENREINDCLTYTYLNHKNEITIQFHQQQKNSELNSDNSDRDLEKNKNADPNIFQQNQTNFQFFDDSLIPEIPFAKQVAKTKKFVEQEFRSQCNNYSKFNGDFESTRSKSSRPWSKPQRPKRKLNFQSDDLPRTAKVAKIAEQLSTTYDPDSYHGDFETRVEEISADKLKVQRNKPAVYLSDISEDEETGARACPVEGCDRIYRGAFSKRSIKAHIQSGNEEHQKWYKEWYLRGVKRASVQGPHPDHVIVKYTKESSLYYYQDQAVCPFCSKYYVDVKGLKKHLKNDHKRELGGRNVDNFSNEFRCPPCGEMFSGQISL